MNHDERDVDLSYGNYSIRILSRGTSFVNFLNKFIQYNNYYRIAYVK